MYCKKCYRQIPDDSVFCPNCGASFKKKLPTRKIIAAMVISLVMFASASLLYYVNYNSKKAYISSISPKTTHVEIKTADPPPVETHPTEKITIPTDPKPEVRYFRMGETATVNGVSITWKNRYVSAGYDIWVPDSGYEFMVYEFTLENNSDSDIYVNPFDFNAFFDDYATNTSTDAELVALESDMQLLSGDLPPGKKMVGVIGYEVPINCKEYDVRYSPSFFGNTVIAFTFNYA